MKKYILISLLILAASKNIVIEYGKEVPFDKNNNIFQFDSGRSDAVFIHIVYGSSDSLNFIMTNSKDSIQTGITSPGRGFIFSVDKDDTYTIRLEYSNPNSNANGTIWVNPMNNEIKVNLTNKYEWKFDYEDTDRKEANLIYSIDNCEKNVTFEFKYNSKMKLRDGSFAKNPFWVFHGASGEGSVTTYNFKEGESYKIEARVIKNSFDSAQYYILPSFKFHDINKKDDEESDTDSDFDDSFSLRLNFWFISLILLIL